MASATAAPRMYLGNHLTREDALTNRLPATPHGYADIVSAHACQTVATSLYPGELFHTLDKFLHRPFEPHWTARSSSRRVAEQQPGCFATFYKALESNGRLTCPLSNAKELRSLLEDEECSTASSSLLFLRGQPSPQWLAEIGAALNVDPTVFQRHLEIRSSFGGRNPFFSPSLPSADDGIVHLRFTTIGRRWPKENDLSQRYVDRLRQNAHEDMDGYLHASSIAAEINVGDSIVRSYHAHSRQYFSIEQQISISVQHVGNRWTVLVWSDAGRDLADGPYGPWVNSASQNSTFFPTLQHLPRIPLRSRQMAVSGKNQLLGKLPQSAALLAVDYGKSLDQELMFHDAFYAVHELFRFCAFSASQFLNMVDAMVTAETGYAAAASEEYTLSNLLYHQDLLEKQVRDLRATIRNIRSRGAASWPRAAEQSAKEKAEAAAHSLFRDYEELLHRAHDISKRCKNGTAVIMSRASIAESKRAISQAEKVEQLSLLAFFYIPLSFTTSFFGMNLGVVGQGDLALWIWFVISIPVLFVSYGLLKLMTMRFKKS